MSTTFKYSDIAEHDTYDVHVCLQAPSCVLDLLSPSTNEELLLRWLTVLANVMWTARDEGITYASLPTDHKVYDGNTIIASEICCISSLNISNCGVYIGCIINLVTNITLY